MKKQYFHKKRVFRNLIVFYCHLQS